MAGSLGPVCWFHDVIIDPHSWQFLLPSALCDPYPCALLMAARALLITSECLVDGSRRKKEEYRGPVPAEAAPSKVSPGNLAQWWPLTLHWLEPWCTMTSLSCKGSWQCRFYLATLFFQLNGVLIVKKVKLGAINLGSLCHKSLL